MSRAAGLGERCALNPDRYRAAHPTTPFSCNHPLSLSLSILLPLCTHTVYTYTPTVPRLSLFLPHSRRVPLCACNAQRGRAGVGVRAPCAAAVAAGRSVSASRTCLNAVPIAQPGSVYYFRACATPPATP